MAKSLLTTRYIAALLLVSDIIGLIVFFNISFWLRFDVWLGGITWAMNWPIVLTLLSLYIFDGYRTEDQVSGMRAPMRAIVGVVFAGLLISGVVYVGGYWGNLFGRGVLPVALLFFATWAAATRFLLSIWVRQRAEKVRWLVLGAGESTAQLWKDFKNSNPEGELAVLSEDEEGETNNQPESPFTIAGTLKDLASWGKNRCSGVIIALIPPIPDQLINQLTHMRFTGTPVYGLEEFYERHWFKVPVFHLQSGWFVFSHGFELLQNPLGLRTKRILDVLFSLALFILLSPLMLIVALLIRLDSKGPAIYRQKRTGKDGKLFTLYKFRSMRKDAEQKGARWASANDLRVTRIGRFIRVTRIDELPQLINVIRGDMSFVGPRPERPEFNEMLEKEIPYYDSRYLVRPGITGWAQVMRTYGASVEDAHEKLQYDLYYIKNYSLLLDIAILLKTLRVILLGKGR